jgi:hypothetical protein
MQTRGKHRLHTAKQSFWKERLHRKAVQINAAVACFACGETVIASLNFRPGICGLKDF